MAWTTEPAVNTTTKFGSLDAEVGTVTTASNGEDGVTCTSRLAEILFVFCNGAANGKTGPFEAHFSGKTITVKAAAGSAGDSALVNLLVLGRR